MEEAKKRDHNKLGREMKIFTTVDVIGQGLPLIMPNGVIIMQELQRWIEDEEAKRGYINQPHLRAAERHGVQHDKAQ